MGTGRWKREEGEERKKKRGKKWLGRSHRRKEEGGRSCLPGAFIWSWVFSVGREGGRWPRVSGWPSAPESLCGFDAPLVCSWLSA